MMRKFVYRVFRVTAAFRPFFLRRFTPAGRLAVAALGVTALFGLNTLMNLAYQGFTLLAGLLAVAVLCSLRFRPQLTVARSLPRFGTVGQPLSYTLRVTNLGSDPLRGLFIDEILPDPRPSWDDFRAYREPREHQRNLFDRTVKYYRWLWLTRLGRRAVGGGIALPDIPAHGEVEVRMTVIPRVRGRLDLESIELARPDPLGLFRALMRVPERGSVTILPHRYRMPPPALPGTRRYQPGGVALASSVGDAEEFVSLREYRPGDPRRHIHWKSWARLGKPIVKEYQEEFFVRHALILDTFGRVPGNDAFEAAVSLAASFVAEIHSHDALLDLMFVGTEAYCFSSGRGLSHSDRMLEILASTRLCRDKPFSALFPSVLDRVGLLSGCICVLMGWDSERRRLVELLKAAGRPLLVLVVTDDEAQAPLDPGPMADNPGHLVALKTGSIEAGLERLGGDTRLGVKG